MKLQLGFWAQTVVSCHILLEAPSLETRIVEACFNNLKATWSDESGQELNIYKYFMPCGKSRDRHALILM